MASLYTLVEYLTIESGRQVNCGENDTHAGLKDSLYLVDAFIASAGATLSFTSSDACGVQLAVRQLGVAHLHLMALLLNSAPQPSASVLKSIPNSISIFQNALRKLFRLVPATLIDEVGIPFAAVNCLYACTRVDLVGSQILAQISPSVPDLPELDIIQQVDRLCSSSPSGLTLLMLALIVVPNDTRCIPLMYRLFLSGCNVNKVAHFEHDLLSRLEQQLARLSIASLDDFRCLCNIALEQHAPFECSALSIAVALKRPQMVTFLIERGAIMQVCLYCLTK